MIGTANSLVDPIPKLIMKMNRLFDPTRISSRIFVLAATFLFFSFLGVARTYAQNPASGPVGPAPAGPSASWAQGMPTSGGGNVNMESSCVEGVTCETFTLTINGTQANWAGQRVQVMLTWSNGGNEYDVYIHQGANTNTSGMGANSGTLVTVAEAGPGLVHQ